MTLEDLLKRAIAQGEFAHEDDDYKRRIFMELGFEVTNPEVVGLGYYQETALDSVFVNEQEVSVAIVFSDHALLFKLSRHSEKNP